MSSAIFEKLIRKTATNIQYLYLHTGQAINFDATRVTTTTVFGCKYMGGLLITPRL